MKKLLGLGILVLLVVFTAACIAQGSNSSESTNIVRFDVAENMSNAFCHQKVGFLTPKIPCYLRF